MKIKAFPFNPLQRYFYFLILVMLTGLGVIFLNVESFAFSSPKPHPLPPTLVKWQDSSNSGDYFDQIKPTEVGYLVWSQFPVKIYLQTPKNISPTQLDTWVKSATQVVQEWSAYLPLTIVTQPTEADIQILCQTPPLQILPGSKIPRARSALTTYKFYQQENTLYHRFQILISPSQTGKYLTAAIRHELGHALGIWGHSLVDSDALYFSQVANPPQISPRDVNTLRRVYQQPTSLGWRNTQREK